MMLSEQERGFGSFVAVAVLGLVFSARPANAQQVKAPLPVDAPERPAVQPEESWIFGLGIGVVSIPKFPGSDSQMIRVLPLPSASYGRFFFGADAGGESPIALGVYLHKDSRWRLGAALVADVTRRRESDDPRLQGLGDVEPTTRSSLFGSYTQGRLSARASVAYDGRRKTQGTLARLSVGAFHKLSERLTVFGGPGLTWGSSRYVRTFFGVDSGQSARSGLPEFEAKGGVTNVNVGIGTHYRIDENWSMDAIISAARLQGDSAASPITERKSQNVVGVLTTYRF
ncbi:MAG TPA: MipA/OmpV family protein [Bradyrhizobium sp.]|nr:MipA/OmpV family protein [Bradyrhizobium sp.]